MNKKNIYLLLIGLMIVFPLVLMGIGLYCCSYKRGFSIDKISSKLAYCESWETTPLSAEALDRLKKEILSQTFYYIGSGNQCYAFASGDDKYVLKFFKMHKILPKNWLRDFPYSLFEKYRLDNVEKRQDVFDNTFKSFKDAYEELKQDSGLIYLHLNKTRDLKTKASIIGYNGKKFLVDLDTKEFVIQLKAKKMCDYLLELRDSANDEELRRAVRSFLNLIALRCKKGLADQDIGMRNNFGVVNGRVIFVDCGHLFRDDSLKYPHYFEVEVIRTIERMSNWAEQFFPDIALILQEEAEDVIYQYHLEDAE